MFESVLQALDLPTDLAGQLESFSTLFLKWNASINLSAARTKDEVAEHIIDSLHVVPQIGLTDTVLDVGSGGGFPVLMIGICRPDAKLVALEPVHKKHAFLRTAARELGLVNVESHARRVEDHPDR